MLLALAVLLPGLYWDQGPGSAATVRAAGIERLHVPAGEAEAWRKQGFAVQPFDATQYEKVPPPGTQYRMSVASATRVPWVDANGWRYLRAPSGRYYCEAPRGAAALAAAEAFAYGADAVIRALPEDLDRFGRMLAFLRRLEPVKLPSRANIGILDDGSDVTGEVLNLLARRNLLFRIVDRPDPALDLNVRIGSAEYPKEEAADPSAFAAKLRSQLTDDKRLVRIYGSDVVIARLEGDRQRARLHLLNYGARTVTGLRVRLLGKYSARIAAFGAGQAPPVDLRTDADSTEFSIPELDVYAVIDLTPGGR
jgi:hypothetical protein